MHNLEILRVYPSQTIGNFEGGWRQSKNQARGPRYFHDLLCFAITVIRRRVNGAAERQMTKAFQICMLHDKHTCILIGAPDAGIFPYLNKLLRELLLRLA